MRPSRRISGDNRAEANEVVLIVEDEAVVRLLVVETLNDLGYQALETADSASRAANFAIVPARRPSRERHRPAGPERSPARGRRARQASRSEGPVRDGIRRRTRQETSFLEPGMEIVSQAVHDGGACQQNPRDDRGQQSEPSLVDEAAGVPNRPPATRCPLELGFLPWPRRPVNSATASSKLLTMVGAIRRASSAFNRKPAAEWRSRQRGRQ